MANVGLGTSGYTFVGQGTSAGPRFLAIGSLSGLTNHGIVIAKGLNAFVASNALGNGQLLIGSNASDPVPNNLTAGSGIVITNGAGSITLAVNPATVGQTITGTIGGALSPTAGNWNILAASTAAGTTPIQTSGSGSTLTIQVQKAQAIAGTDATKIGLSAFDSARFSVDANGFVSASGTGLGQTITGDTGGALSPTAGNWNIVSTATNGIDTSGSGSTLTVAMATPYADGDFEFRSSVSGATRTLSVTNTSNTASSQATLLTSVAGTSAGDAWHQFTIGTTRSYSIGADNSDANDSLKFTTDSDGTVDPSSGTFMGAMNPATGGFEWGPDSNATSSSTIIVNAQKNQNDVTELRIKNDSATGAAQAWLATASDGCTGSFRCRGANYTGDANAVFFQGDTGCTGRVVYGSDGIGCTIEFKTNGNSVANCTANGEWTYTRQPAFLAFNSATDTNATGDGTTVTVDFDTEVFDVGGNFSADTFTAPVTGKYQLNTVVYVNGLSVANTLITLAIVTSNRTYQMDIPHLVANSNHSVNMSVLADMDSGDTATVTLAAAGSTKTSGIFGNGTLLVTSFSGHLAC